MAFFDVLNDYISKSIFQFFALPFRFILNFYRSMFFSRENSQAIPEQLTSLVQFLRLNFNLKYRIRRVEFYSLVRLPPLYYDAPFYELSTCQCIDMVTAYNYVKNYYYAFYVIFTYSCQTLFSAPAIPIQNVCTTGIIHSHPNGMKFLY